MYMSFANVIAKLEGFLIEIDSLCSILKEYSDDRYLEECVDMWTENESLIEGGRYIRVGSELNVPAGVYNVYDVLSIMNTVSHTGS